MPYSVITDYKNHEIVRVEYLYFHNLELWFHRFIAKDIIAPSTDIKNNKNETIISFQYDIDPWKCSPMELENKIKTWVTFS